MPNQISKKKILIGGFCLALVFVTSVITIAYGNLRALRLLTLVGNSLSFILFFWYYHLQREITEQKQREESPQKSAQHYAIVEPQTELICRFLPDGTLTFVNDAYCSDFSQSREQLIERKFVMALISEAITEKSNPLPLLGILYDKESAYLQAYRFFNLSLDLLVIGNFEGKFTLVNQSWERILGFTPEELIAQPFLEFIHLEDRAMTQREMEKLNTGIPLVEFDNRYRCKDGSYKWLSWTVKPFPEEGLIYGIVRDINKQKQASEAWVQQVKRERLLGATLERIRQSLNLDEIIATTVTEVRQLLKADRVFFFRLDDTKRGRVVAESVTQNCPVTREMMFTRQDFPTECYEFYSLGESRIIPDVAKDRWASCLVEFMQQVGVKSKIVVPIVQKVEGNGDDFSQSSSPKLWGLFIAHACTDYRQWQQVDVELLAILANQLAIAIKQADLDERLQIELAERKRAEESLRQTYDELEIKVQQRTAQLTKSNESLSTEITERKHLEEVLRQRNQEFIALVENAPDIIARIDQDLRHLYINPAIERATNIAPEEFIGKTNQELGMPLEFISTLEIATKNVFATGKEETVEFHYPTSHGTRYYQSRLVPELASDGTVASILAVGRDITERRQTEEVVKVREQQLRAIFESVVDAIVIVDDDGYYVDANPAATKLFSLPYYQLLGKKVSDFMEPDFDFELAWRAFQEQRQVSGALRLIREDGTVRDVEYSAIANFLPGRHLSVMHDITERQQAQTALREKEQQLMAIAANIPGAVYRCLLHGDGEMSLLYISEGIEELVGIGSKEAIAHPKALLARIHPDDRQQFYENKRKFKQTLQPFPLKFRVISQSGNLKWIRDSARYLTSGTDGNIFVDGVILDVSDVYDEHRRRQEAELALRENQRLLQQIADTTLTIIYIFSINEQRNVYLNRYGHEFFGKTSQEIQDLGEQFFSEILYPEQLQKLGEFKQRLIAAKEGEVLENELYLKNAHGEWRWFHTWEVVFTRTSDGQPEQILGTAIDITEQKRSQEIHYALETEKELRKLQLRFFSMASHEFRTPLSTILVTAQLMGTSAQDWSAEKRRRNINRIEATAKNMTQLLDDILTFTRAETGKLELNPKLIDLEAFCHYLIGELQLNIGSKSLVNFLSQGESKKAVLDEKLLHSSLINLLSNAIKYSPEGGDVTLTLIFEQDQVIFQVQDQGIGIPEDYQQHLFEPFHRGSNTGNIPGTGLGLAVVKRCLELQGGAIDIDSKVGVGTSVKISLPIIVCELKSP